MFTPSVRAYVRNTLAIGGLAIPVLIALFFQHSDKLLFLMLVAGAAVASIGGVLLHIARARIFVTADSLGRRGFGRTKWMSRKAVRRSLLVLNLSAGTASPTHLFLFAPDSALVMRLYGALWGEAQLRALTDALGVEQNVRASQIEVSELRALEPTALNWIELNPKAVTGLVLGGFAVIAVVVAVMAYQLR